MLGRQPDPADLSSRPANGPRGRGPRPRARPTAGGPSASRPTSRARSRTHAMSILRSAARNLSIVGGTRLITWLASFAFTIFLARDLGAEAFGQLSLALAYIAFFTIFVDFGLSQHLSRIVAQRSGDPGQAIGAVMLLRAALWLV